MSDLIKLKRTPPYNFNNIKLTKEKKLLFIHYTSAKIKIENDLCSDNNIDIMYIKYEKDLDANKIISWLNNDFDYITIVLARVLKDTEFDKLMAYCKFVKNKKSIMVIYLYTLKKKLNLEKLNKDIDQKLIIPFRYTYDSYITRYDNILSIPITYLYNIIDTKTPPVIISESMLSATWFYQYVINKFYSCATGRLRQISGTCYANSVLNCILLSKPLKALFFMQLKKDIKKHANLLDSVKEKIGADCPANNKLFVYRFLYNLMCTDYKPTMKLKYKDDINNPDNIMTKITKKVVNVTNRNYYSQIFSDNLFIDVFGDLYKSTYYDDSYYDEVVEKNIYFPITSYLKHPIDEDKCLKITYPVNDYLDEINEYTIIACTIFLSSNIVKNSNHLICGYICDGEYMIYDSASNYIVRYNWLSSRKMKDFKIKMDLENTLDFRKYVNCYYIKNSYIKELEEYKICP